MARILVVDDEEGVRSFLADTLCLDGHHVTEAEDGEVAARLLAKTSFSVVLTDLRMPNKDGLTLLRELAKEQPEVEVVVLTAHGSVDSAVEAMKLGAFDYVQKPIGSPAELRLVVTRALEHHRLRAGRDASAPPAPPPLGYGSDVMEQVERALSKVAATDATVLLTGESGTGKEVAARAVHTMSKRRKAGFVAVNCAALSANLLESELFGHERGAFTGASARRRGRIELADGGTFFLDEIGELALDLQAKLLRVLQERRFERVGGSQTVECDVRWIAATNRDLEAMIEQGTFREDLYHRLAVFPVRMPSLMERREDVGPLADLLLREVAAELGRPGLALTDEARRALADHPWRGNVRELRNCLERSAILVDGAVLEDSDLALPGLRRSTKSSGAEPLPTMDDAERDAIERALAHFDGNRKKAADHLGIGVRTLYDKLKRYGI